MTHPTSQTTGAHLTRRQKLLFALLGGAFVLLLGGGLGEIALRLLPLAGLSAPITTYDAVVGVRLLPEATVRYYNARGDFIKRKINHWGSLDDNWSREKPAGIFRIGFFGDSYTEARQVQLDSCFFRRIANRLGQNIQTLAFGCSGYSMLQAYLYSRREAPKFALDMVVYVFSENDLGDQLESVGGPDYMNRPFLLPDSQLPYKIDNAFQQRYAYRQNWRYQLVDYLESRSLLLYTIHRRLVLLQQYGVNATLSAQEREHGGTPHLGNAVNQNTPPSQWPDSLRQVAQNLAAAVLRDWKNENTQAGMKFAVLYVPRQNQLLIPTLAQDSWKPWLEHTCRELSIPFIDPTGALVQRANAGREVYYDHFTPAGHDAVAETFVAWYHQQ